MSQALRQRRSQAPHSAARPRPITSAQTVRLDADEEAERLRREQEARRKRQKRRLDELERVNYRDAPSTLSLPDDGNRSSPSTTDNTATTTEGGGGGTRKRSRANAEVKRILSTRKGFSVLLEEANAASSSSSSSSDRRLNYLSIAARPSAYPPRSLCSVCSYWGDAACPRCGERYCGLKCAQTHDETRCDRPRR